LWRLRRSCWPRACINLPTGSPAEDGVGAVIERAERGKHAAAQDPDKAGAKEISQELAQQLVAQIVCSDKTVFSFSITLHNPSSWRFEQGTKFSRLRPPIGGPCNYGAKKQQSKKHQEEKSVCLLREHCFANEVCTKKKKNIKKETTTRTENVCLTILHLGNVLRFATYSGGPLAFPYVEKKIYTHSSTRMQLKSNNVTNM
jgi:hypothetical protein